MLQEHITSLPLFQIVSIPASIATTGIRSDAPYEHAQYQGWIIGVEYRCIIHPYGAIGLVHFTRLCNWRASEASETLSGVTQSRFRYIWQASEASETLSGVYKFELVRYVYIYIYIYIYMYGGTYVIIVAHAMHT